MDIEINFLSKILFVLMLILSLSIVFLNGFHGDWLMFYFRIVLLLSSIIPISLRVNLDLAKMWYSYCINRDEQIPGSVARNSTIPEELGRVQFLISDKTGTLTQNDMVCKRLLTEFAQFSADASADDLRELVLRNCRLHPEGPAGDLAAPQRRREQHQVCRDLLTALALCNNVTPVSQEPELRPPPALHKHESLSNFGASSYVASHGQSPANHSPKESLEKAGVGEPVLQASSPDEIALVKFASEMGAVLLERDRSSVQIRNADGKYENYEVLANFPFSSETKKMSVLLRQRETNRYLYYVKGAEVVMETKVKPA